MIGDHLHTISAPRLCRMPSPPRTLLRLIHNCLQYSKYIYSQLCRHSVCTSAYISSMPISIASAHPGAHPRMTFLLPSARRLGSLFSSHHSFRLCLIFGTFFPLLVDNDGGISTIASSMYCARTLIGGAPYEKHNSVPLLMSLLVKNPINGLSTSASSV